MRILFFLVILVTWTKFHFATSWDLEALFSESENGSGDQGEPKANENELRQVLNSQPLSKGKNKKQRNAKVEMGDILASDACAFSNDASKIIYSILCAVETGEWHIAHESQSMKEAQEGCLIGGSGSTRCDQKMRPPREEDVPKSPPPPDAKVSIHFAFCFLLLYCLLYFCLPYLPYSSKQTITLNVHLTTFRLKTIRFWLRKQKKLYLKHGGEKDFLMTHCY